MSATTSKAIYNKIVDAADAHGQESEPEHEVGDLQVVLMAALELMTPDQLKKLDAMLPDMLSTLE